MALNAYHLLLGFLILHFQAFPLRNPLQIVQASPLCTQSLHAAKPSARTICGSRNSDVNTSVDVIGSEIRPFAHDPMKEKVVNATSIIRREAINLTLDNSGLVQFGYENCGSREVYKGMLECVNNSFTELFQKEKGIVSIIIAKSSEQVKDMKCRRKPEPGTLENEVVRSLIGFHTSKHNPLEFTENEDDKDAHGFSSL